MNRDLKYPADPIGHENKIIWTTYPSKGLHFRNSYQFDMAFGRNRHGKGRVWGIVEDMERSKRTGLRYLRKQRIKII